VGSSRSTPTSATSAAGGAVSAISNVATEVVNHTIDDAKGGCWAGSLRACAGRR
jgi:hypothetical protein